MMALQVMAGRAEAVCVSTVSFGLLWRGFGPFENLVRRFIGRASFNGGGFVGFEVGKRFGLRFCGRALMRARSCSGGIKECAGHISAE